MGNTVSNLQIAVVGRANVGKSLLIDCIFNQRKINPKELIEKGKESRAKTERILPNGKIALFKTVIIDEKPDTDLDKSALSESDFYILVLEAREELFNIETELISYFQKNQIPFLVAVNKIEFGTNPHLLAELDALEVIYFELSCKENAGIENFRKTLIHLLPGEKKIN